MDNHERIRTILKHCIQNECYGCPLRQSRECVRSMAFSANQEIVHLEKHVKELEKSLAAKQIQVTQGCWEDVAMDYKCSVCGKEFHDDLFWVCGECVAPNYCPNCGAQMSVKEGE